MNYEIYSCICTCMYACLRVCMHMYVLQCMCTCMYAYVRVCAYVSVCLLHMCTHMYVCVCVSTHVYAHVRRIVLTRVYSTVFQYYAVFILWFECVLLPHPPKLAFLCSFSKLHQT